MPGYIAVDLGAESGRLVRGAIEKDRLRIEEIARFPNEMIRMRGHLYWNLLGMFSEIKHALGATAFSPPDSIGVDTWGVDFVLLASDGSLAGQPVAYRDARTDGMMEKFFERMTREKIYGKTGIQFLQLNTLYQLFAMSEQKSPHLATATDLLFVSDFFHFLFSGEKSSEFSIATTSQMVNVLKNEWDAELIEAAGVSPALFQKIFPPGAIVGNLTEEIGSETGLKNVPIIAPAAHDTGSAVAAVPAEGEDWAYISSGTWSLMGIETKKPILTDDARRFNFTNEGGVDNTYRFLKNIMGLWLVQRIRADLKGRYDYADLAKLADEADPFVSMIDVEDMRFHNPASMVDAISAYCKETGQPTPESPGAHVRCALESLSLYYRVTLEQLRKVRNGPINRIHVLGGGSKNELLCQMTANATGLPVLAGPTEATAIGNIIIQAQALGHIGSLSEARALVRKSMEFKEYKPAKSDAWDVAMEKYVKVMNRPLC